MNQESNQIYYHSQNAYSSYWSGGSDYTTSSNESSESTSPLVDTSNPIRNPYYNYFMCSSSFMYNQYMSPHLRDANQIATNESFQQQVQLMPTSTPLSSRHRQTRKPILDTNTVHDHFESEILPLINAVQSSNASKRRMRTSFTMDQRHQLLHIFEQNIYPSKDLIDRLSTQMSVSVSIIQTWFKNMRAKKKKLVCRN